MTPIRRLGTAFSITVLVLAASRPVAARPAPARIGAAGQVPMSEAMRRQIRLSQAAKVIRTEVEQGNNSGYAGIELTDNQVLVWWKGAMPAPVAQAVTRGARCTTGFPVEAEQIYGQTAVRLSDSGGPVYTYSAAGGVIAKGINSYTYNDYVLGFQDFGTAVMDYGIWIAS